MTANACSQPYIAGSLLLIFFVSSHAQESLRELPPAEFPAEVSCKIEVSNSSPLPFEPVTVLVTATYNGSESVIVTTRTLGQSVLYAKTPSTSPTPSGADDPRIHWNEFSPDLLVVGGGLRIHQRRTLIPSELPWYSLTLWYDFRRGVHVVQEPSNLLIRGTSHGKVSDPIVLAVRAPTGKNRKAWETLKALDTPVDFPFLDSRIDYDREATCLGRLPMFLSSGGAIAYYFEFHREIERRRGLTPSPADFEGLEARLRGFARDFSDSDYAPLTLLGVGHLWLAVGKPLKARDAFLDVSAQGTSPRAEEAAYYLGVCEERLGNKTTAADRYRQVRQGKPDPVTSFLAEKALEDLSSK